MVLVCYRAQTYVQLWMNSTTCFCASLPRSATPRCQPCRKDWTWHVGVSPSLLLPSKRHTRTLSLPRQLYIAIWGQGPTCQFELTLVHSPLLQESLSVCFPPLTYLLKFSGSVNPTSHSIQALLLKQGSTNTLLPKMSCRASSGANLHVHTSIPSTLSSIGGFKAPSDALQQTMMGTSLQEFSEAVCTFRNQLIHGILQITMHITAHCILHQCLSQGICRCTRL